MGDGFRALLVTVVYLLPAWTMGLLEAAGGFHQHVVSTVLRVLAHLLLPFALLLVAADRHGAAYRIGQLLGAIRQHLRAYVGLLLVLAAPAIVAAAVTTVVHELVVNASPLSTLYASVLSLILTGYWGAAVMGTAAGLAGRRLGITPRSAETDRIAPAVMSRPGRLSPGDCRAQASRPPRGHRCSNAIHLGVAQPNRLATCGAGGNTGAPT